MKMANWWLSKLKGVIMVFNKFARPKKTNPVEEVSAEEEKKDEVPIFNLIMPSAEPESKVRALGLIGDLDEEKASEVMYGMISLYKSGIKQELKDLDDPECEEIVTTKEPFEFIISTYGGSALDMFGIYDLMRQIKDSGCEIGTYGLGKVMSAGVLLLASGTKGKRKIGANCRVMIHSVAGGSQGAIHNLETEMDEIRWLQDQYIERLVEETKMSENYLRKLLKKKVNVYLSAEEAVELGIADEVI